MYGMVVFSGGHGRDRFDRAGEVVRRAEEAGFDAVWTGELYNRSATIPMANMALSSSRVRIGSNIAYGVGRSPLIWAAEARDLDELSEGRLTLGLGNGTAGMMENWHGVSGEAPALRMEEFIDVFRKLWRLHEGPVHHEGRFYNVHLTTTADTLPPIQGHLPIWIAGIGPRMVLAAGKKADGLVGHPMFTGRYVQEVIRPQLQKGAVSAERDPDDLAVMGILMCGIGEDQEAERRRMAYSIAQYAASKVYDGLFEMHGWGAAQLQIREAARQRDTDAMIAAVPDEAIDAIGVVCKPAELRERVAEHAKDYDHLALVTMPWGLNGDEAEVATLQIIEHMR
ncbi:LLM class flavin-dependent oxidoreductase [Nocardioides seonyuensis]|uniref:LLM class flavin-dependent oxidoreductase n=2 Tax=Nocardioides seonyuensis TaxID=2518371 RepID=A0A4P7IH00_9ACTN|nr:LLM class flavin-dependent oxidoreductase [Nocardioides seonyuensis]